MRRWLLFPALAALCAAPAFAQEADPAALLPDDCFVYVEVDAAALEKGLPELQVMKLLADPRFREYFAPTFKNLGLDPEKPAAALLERLKVKDFLAGPAVIGVRGVTARLDIQGGEKIEFHHSADRPFDARTAYKILGFTLRMEWDEIEVVGGTVNADFLAVIEPGPALKAIVAAGLQSNEVATEKIKIGEREVLRATWTPWGRWGPPMEFFLNRSGKRWIIGTNKKTFAEALAGGPRVPLTQSKRLQAARARMTAGHRVAFAYVDMVPLLKMVETLIPPILDQANEINGLAALRGVGFGLSINEGGVRESIGIVLDGNPRGVWKLFDAFPGGMRGFEVSPPKASAAFGFKFDMNLLVQRWQELAKEVLPGNEKLLTSALTEMFGQGGIDFEKEVLPAFGDEIGVFVFPPRGGMIPNVVFGLDVRDEAVFKKLLEKAKAMAAQGGAVRFQPLNITEEIEGFQVFSMLPMQTAFAVHKGHLWGASSPQLLRTVLTEWAAEGAPNLLKNDEVFPQVLNGLGAKSDTLVALGYVNVRGVLPQVYPMLGMMGVQLPPNWVDVTQVPDLNRMAKHFTGAAVGLRRDANGITLDAYSPTGLIVPSTVYAIHEEMERQARWRREMIARRAAAQARGPAALGVVTMTSDGETGVTVLGFHAKSPLHGTGMKKGDKITAFAGVKIKSIEDLRRELGKHKVGAEIKVTCTRGEFTVKLVHRNAFQ